MAATARTPKVQLVLNVGDELHEYIVRVTTGHEVVEARHNGKKFLYKRKRSTLQQPAEEAAPPAPSSAHRPTTSVQTNKSRTLRTPAAALLMQQAATAARTPAGSPYADELELPRALGPRLLRSMQALPERATPSDRLLAICSCLGEAAVEAAAAGPNGAARSCILTDAFADFRCSLAAALADETIRVAAPPHAPTTPSAAAEEGEVEQPDYAVDLQARKAGLRARLANFRKEEQEWQDLLQQVEQLDQAQLAASSAGAAGPAAAAQGGAAGDTATAEATTSTAMALEAPAAGGQQDPGDELAALAAAHAGLHRHLSMQVEGLCKLVGDVEEVAERAARAAQAVQAGYQAEKLRAFPHVNSPARLIRELVRPAGGKAQAAAATGEGKEAAQPAAAAEDKENAPMVA